MLGTTPVPGVAQANPAPIAMPPQQGVPLTTNPITPVANVSNQPSGSSGTNQVAQIIQAARDKGVPDPQIFDFLHQKGLIPTNAVVQQGQQAQQPTQPEGPSLHDTGSYGGNVVNSAENFLGGIGKAIAHPLDTLENVSELGMGLLNKVGLGGVVPGGNLQSPEFKQAAAAKVSGLVDYYKERYGGIDNFMKTVAQDPMGTLADASILLSGLGGVASAVGDTSKISALSDIGSTASRAGELANPLNAVTKPLEIGANLASAGLKNLGPMLEKTSLRLTPTQKVAWADKLPEITDYISKYIPAAGPEGRLEAASARVDQFENVISDFINNDASHITKNREDLLAEIEGLKQGFNGERDAIEMDSQVDGFKKLLESRYPDEIPLADIQALKRSTFKNAFNKAGTKVSDAVEYQLGDVLKNTIETKTEGLGVLGKYPIAEINKAYGIALNAKKLLRIAAGRPQVDFVNRLVADMIGGAIGSTAGPMGTAAGVAAGNVVSRYAPATAIKSAVGKTGRAASKLIPKVKVPTGTINTVSRINKATQ